MSHWDTSSGSTTSADFHGTDSLFAKVPSVSWSLLRADHSSREVLATVVRPCV
jgi:hypothetical protein